MSYTRAVPSLVMLAALLAACAGAGSDDSGTTPTRPATSPDVDALPSGTQGTPVTGEVPAAILDQILADAEARTGVPAGEIVVTRAQEQEWSDGSLDCPEPGQMYTQAIEPGYHVLLEAGGEELDYRATVRGLVRLCESEGPPFGG
jgi:hypothetical protein